MRLRSPLVWLATLPAIALLVHFVWHHHYTCVKGEQWGLVPIVDRLLSGELSFADVWAQKNAHRIVFPKLILFATVWLDDWNPRHEALTACAFGVAGLFGVLATLLPSVRCERRGVGFALVLGVSAFVLSLSQFENWIWGMQITVTLCFAASVFGLALLARGPTTPRVAGAAVLGLVATFSLSLGLVFWPVALLLLVLAPRDPAWAPAARRRAGVAWVAVSVAASAAFLHGFRRGGHFGDGLADVERTVRYVLVYLGNPVAVEPRAAMLAGAFALVLAGALILWHLRQRTPREEWVFAVAWLAFALVAGLLTSSGRAQLAPDQALSSRYIPFANLLWLGDLGLLVAYWAHRPLPAQGAARLADGAAVLFVCVVLGGGGFGAWRGYRYGIVLTERVDAAREAVLATWPDVPPQVIAVLNPSRPEETLRTYLPILERRRLSLFRDAEPEPSRRKETRRARERGQK